MMYVDPNLEDLYQAARALTEAAASRRLTVERLGQRPGTPADKRAALTAAVEQEYAAINALLKAAYDDRVLDWVCVGTVKA